MNKLYIIGNLTHDPETRTTSTGVNVCTFSVAVNRRFGGQNGQPETDYFRVSAWRGLGENCQKYLAKGRKVAVVGSVRLNTYTKTDGTTGANMEISAEDVEFLTPKSEAGFAPTATAPAATSVNPTMGFEEVSEDELPF